MANSSHSSENGHNNGVIALSPFRAWLARGRRELSNVGARATLHQLLANPELGRTLPLQHLYRLLHDIGIAEAMEVVPLLSAEQIRGILDLDTWRGEELVESRLQPWFAALLEGGPETLLRATAALDRELVVLYIQRNARIYDVSLEENPETDGRVYATPDGFFLLELLAGSEESHTFLRWIDLLYRADLEFTRTLLQAAKWELGSELVEWALRWRQGRMSDLGYPEPAQALSLYQPLSAEQARREKPTHFPVELTQQWGETAPALVQAMDGAPLLAQILPLVTDETKLRELVARLSLLLNRALAAEKVSAFEEKQEQAVCTRTLLTVSLGLEILLRHEHDETAPFTEGGLAYGRAALEHIAPEILFRVAYDTLVKIRKLAANLQRNFRFQADGPPLFDPPHQELLEKLAQVFPAYPTQLDPPGQRGQRPFATLREIARATSLLQELGAQAGFFDALGIRAADVARAAQSAITPAASVSAGTVARTLFGLHLLGQPFVLRPVSPRELRQMGTLIRNRVNAQQESSFLTLLDARLADTGSPIAEPLWRSWVQAWLAQTPEKLHDPDGVLVRFSWLK